MEKSGKQHHNTVQQKKSCRGEHGRRPTFGTNEMIFTERKIFETKVVPRGMLYTIVYYPFNKNINSTNNTKNKTEKNAKTKTLVTKKNTKENMKNRINFQETQEIKIIKKNHYYVTPH